jgi:hypothetical protein
MATLRFRLGALLLGAAMTLGMAACTHGAGSSTSAPLSGASSTAPSTGPSTTPSPASSPSAVPPGSSTTPAAPPAGQPTGHPTKGPLEPDNPLDPRATLTLTGTIHTTGACVFLDTPSGRWYLGAAPQTLHDGASVTVRGRRIAPPTKCAANHAVLVQQVS